MMLWVILGTLLLVIAIYIRIRKTNSSTLPSLSQAQSPQPQTQKSLYTSPQAKDPQTHTVHIKTLQEIQQQYEDIYYNALRLKPQKSVHQITAIDFSGSKLIVADTKNELVLFDLKNLKKDSKDDSHHGFGTKNQRFFVSLDNNSATAITIGSKYYYAALDFDKTVVYYEFKGGVNDIYFKEIHRFARNSLKSNAGKIWVPQHQNYIVTSGTGADTVIDVWSPKGQKLGHVNTYQIEHYQITFGIKDILVRGWTSETKIFTFIEEKDKSFSKLQKKLPIAHQQSPEFCVIDNQSMYASSISKNHHFRLWPLYESFHMASHSQKYIENSELQKLVPTANKCAIYTLETMPGHYKTIIVISNDDSFVIMDSKLNLIKKVEGVDCSQVMITGKNKHVILGVVGKNSRIILWNLSQEINLCCELKQ